MKPRIIIPHNLFLRLRSDPTIPRYCYGLIRRDEGLVQILSLLPQDDLQRVAQICSNGIKLEGFSRVVPFAALETISVNDDFTARSQGIIDTNVIGGKKVAFVGVGSVGSQLALHLAQSAVNNFILLDPDTFSATNLSRHACDLRDLARYKTKAVRDLIMRRNPGANIQTFEDDFLALSWPEQAERLKGANLVIASTDSTPVQFMVNEICHSLQIPSLYVGCYERACAGEILYVLPGRTACFNCFMEFRQSNLSELKKKEHRIPYSDETPSEFKGEPGLAIDIAYVVTVASAYALALLLPDSARSKLLDLEKNLTLVHSGSIPQGRYREIFQIPFDLLLASVKRDYGCPICQHTLSSSGEIDGSPTDLS
jgi:hypothetical protein